MVISLSFQNVNFQSALVDIAILVLLLPCRVMIAPKYLVLVLQYKNHDVQLLSTSLITSTNRTTYKYVSKHVYPAPTYKGVFSCRKVVKSSTCEMTNQNCLVCFTSTINTIELLMCDFGRIKLQHVSFHIALPHKFLQAYGTNDSVNASVNCNVIVKNYIICFKSIIKITKLLMCDFGRMELQHVSFHIALPHKFLHAYGTNVNASVNCNVAVKNYIICIKSTTNIMN